jgi:hypothetical protein
LNIVDFQAIRTVLCGGSPETRSRLIHFSRSVPGQKDGNQKSPPPVGITSGGVKCPEIIETMSIPTEQPEEGDEPTVAPKVRSVESESTAGISKSCD